MNRRGFIAGIAFEAIRLDLYTYGTAAFTIEGGD